MCRHLAYLGRPVTLEELVAAPPYSLVRQSWAPRMQRHGTVNVDGFGVGWYAAVRPEPVRYRRAQAVWTDASFASLAPTITSSCVLAAVRSATPGFGHDESCAPPFTHGTWLYSHNGRLVDWPQARRELLLQTLGIPEAAAPVDSALLFGLAASRWAAGASLGCGLSESVRLALACGGGRLTQLAVDGTRIAATTYGEPLYLRQRPDSVEIASEPYDDDVGWVQLPDQSLVEATTEDISVVPLAHEHIDQFPDPEFRNDYHPT